MCNLGSRKIHFLRIAILSGRCNHMRQRPKLFLRERSDQLKVHCIRMVCRRIWKFPSRCRVGRHMKSTKHRSNCIRIARRRIRGCLCNHTLSTSQQGTHKCMNVHQKLGCLGMKEVHSRSRRSNGKMKNANLHLQRSSLTDCWRSIQSKQSCELRIQRSCCRKSECPVCSRDQHRSDHRHE